MIPDDVITQIRDAADIISVIGQHVQLRKAGRNWKGLCPFHGEKTPSFNVAPDKGFFYCFGCRKKGDAFTFIMEYQGKSFTEAAEVLAAQCGVAIPETVASPEAMRARGVTSVVCAGPLPASIAAHTSAPAVSASTSASTAWIPRVVRTAITGP